MNQLLISLRRASVALAIGFALVSAAPAPAAATQGGNVKVKRVTFPVTLSDGNSYSIVGYLYYKGTYKHRTLQLAIHGGTYDHRYWDIPEINGQEYSYARYMAREHYAVLAIDQLGVGESSIPDGDFMTMPEAASGVHQVITSLRSSHNPVGHDFENIILVGHSMGAITATYVQAVYNDADGLVSTGSNHVPYAVPLDPVTVNGWLQQPYFTFQPEVRSALFYHAPAADPDVIAYDNATLASFLSRGMFTSIVFNLYDTSKTKVDLVQSPVLVQLGEFDAIAPGANAADEALLWESATDLTVTSLPGIGHDYNAHLNNTEGWAQIDEWIEDRVGSH